MNIEQLRKNEENDEYLKPLEGPQEPKKRRADLRGDTQIVAAEDGLLQQQAEQALLRHLALEGEVAYRRDQTAGQLDALNRELASLRGKREALIVEAKRLGVELQL